jgi:hypothetical protein
LEPVVVGTVLFGVGLGLCRGLGLRVLVGEGVLVVGAGAGRCERAGPGARLVGTCDGEAVAGMTVTGGAVVVGGYAVGMPDASQAEGDVDSSAQPAPGVSGKTSDDSALSRQLSVGQNATATAVMITKDASPKAMYTRRRRRASRPLSARLSIDMVH